HLDRGVRRRPALGRGDRIRTGPSQRRAHRLGFLPPSLTSVAAMTDAIRATVRELMPALRSDLEDLIRIQSVSADPDRHSEVEKSAVAVRDVFAAEGFDARIVRT